MSIMSEGRSIALSGSWVERLLRAGRPVELELRGDSMTPSVRDGDLLTVAPLGDGRIQRGDVVLARIGGRLVAHRVVLVDGANAQLRGDASPRVDAVPVDALLGRVVGVRRRRGPLRRGFRAALRRVRSAWLPG
jgi:phage repressor protein C with HTH and peptisase S24 domain